MAAELFEGDAFPRYAPPPPASTLVTGHRHRPRGAHRGARKPVGWKLATLITVLAVAAGLLLALAAAPRSHAATVPMRVRALEWAEAQAGKPYIYGGTGPAGFDCSGLVMMAWLRGAGLRLPRTTWEMAADLSRLRVIPYSQARRGDLVFYGTGHVELKTAHGTFGALEPGTVIGWHRPSGWWRPTFAMALR